jgi:hypothetical protein
VSAVNVAVGLERDDAVATMRLSGEFDIAVIDRPQAALGPLSGGWQRRGRALTSVPARRSIAPAVACTGLPGSL